MSHDISIPLSLHTGKKDELHSSLGSFWNSVFSDQELVDAIVAARVLAASQFHIDAMEALSLRDHRSTPVFHREHWYPILVRRSQQNSGSGLHLRMPDRTVIGPQTEDANSGHVYLEGEVFQVGGNASYSKVNTYPLSSGGACRVVGVKTCICDSISDPTNILIPDRDFSIRDGVLVVRKEKDPFSSSGYLVTEDADDSVAVMWACDAEIDTNNVGDFLGYPLGIDADSCVASARMLSALWDVVIYGVTPLHLNRVIGAVFGVEVIESDTTVESVSGVDSSGMCTVVTSDNVYRIPSAGLGSWVKAGESLAAGSFLRSDISVHWGMSQDEVADMISQSVIPNLAIPVGGVYGVSSPVVLENRNSAVESGWWFRLNEMDSSDSPFWSAVFGRTTEQDRKALVLGMVNGGTASSPTVNPLRALGYSVLANLILVVTRVPLVDSVCARTVFEMLGRFFPSFSALLAVQFFHISDTADEGQDELKHTPGSDSEKLDNKKQNEDMGEAEDSLSLMFVPYAATEV